MSDHIPDTEKMVDRMEVLEQQIKDLGEATASAIGKLEKESEHLAIVTRSITDVLEANQKFIYEALHTISTYVDHKDIHPLILLLKERLK